MGVKASITWYQPAGTEKEHSDGGAKGFFYAPTLYFLDGYSVPAGGKEDNLKLTEKDIDLSTLVISEEQNVKRTPGIHVSAIIRHIGLAIGTNKGNNFTEDDLNNFAIVGRLWERVLADLLFPPPRYERVGEVEKDGIIGSPDCVDTENWSDVEMKVTWVSSKGFTERQKFRDYLYQAKAYCYILKMVRARLVVLHICGGYAPPVPVAKEYDLLFTPAELVENWRMLKANVPKEMIQ